jgi:hypothetical protein
LASSAPHQHGKSDVGEEVIMRTSILALSMFLVIQTSGSRVAPWVPDRATKLSTHAYKYSAKLIDMIRKFERCGKELINRGCICDLCVCCGEILHTFWKCSDCDSFYYSDYFDCWDSENPDDLWYEISETAFQWIRRTSCRVVFYPAQ